LNQISFNKSQKWSKNEGKEKGMFINQEKCKNCTLCVSACPTKKISVVGETFEISKDCLNTVYCTAAQICPENAIERTRGSLPEGTLRCYHCFLRCEIRPNNVGECRRYVNRGGAILRSIPFTPYEEVMRK
jgi:Fe-S-cluster-containing hydrogenase component 2